MKISCCNSYYISYSEAIDPVISELYKNDIKTLLTEDQYKGLLNLVFQEELEKVPINLEKYVVLYNVLIRLYCEICAVKISYFNCVESCIKEVLSHIKGKKHVKNVATLSFDLGLCNFDLDDAVTLPYDVFPTDLMEEKKYFKTCLYLFFKCNVCQRKFSAYNKVLPIRRVIYNHINEWEHVSKYIKKFPKMDCSGVSSKDVILASIDSIYEKAQTYVSKELYLDVLLKIFQDKLEKIPDRTEKYITIRLDLSINCSVCMRQILKCHCKDLLKQIELHIRGKKHNKSLKPFLQPNCDKSKIDKYTESVINNDMIKVPNEVLSELFTLLKHSNYEKKVKNYIFGHFLFHIGCIVCDKIMVTTNSVSNAQRVIYAHINNKEHVSAALNRILL